MILFPKTRTYGDPRSEARSINLRASASGWRCFCGSLSCKLAEVLTHEIRRPRAATSFVDCPTRAELNSGHEGRSMVPCNPRSSTAAKPFCTAKSRILSQFQLGQPSVEKPMGKRLPPARRAFASPPLPTPHHPRHSLHSLEIPTPT